MFCYNESYLCRMWHYRMGYKLDLENPRTFNEKLQWLKLHDRKPIYTTMVDKYVVKSYVAELIGEKYIIPTLGIWNHFDEINFDSLPKQFVLKCTHDSGGIVIIKDKANFDKKAAKNKLEKSLKRNYFWHEREWPYKDVKPRILAEKYMEDVRTTSSDSLLSSSLSSEHMLNVYKIFNFMGQPELIQVIQDDKTRHETIDYFDTNWNLFDLRQNFPNSTVHLKRPEQLEKMLTLAKQLSAEHAFLRTDFYEINGDVFFSEFTFFSDSGFAAFEPEKWDKTLGDLIILPDDKGKSQGGGS